MHGDELPLPGLHYLAAKLRSCPPFCAYCVLAWSIDVSAAISAWHLSRACCAITESTLLEETDANSSIRNMASHAACWRESYAMTPPDPRGWLADFRTEPHHNSLVVVICRVSSSISITPGGVSWLGPGRDAPFLLLFAVSTLSHCFQYGVCGCISGSHRHSDILNKNTNL